MPIKSANNQLELAPVHAKSWQFINPTTLVFKLRKDIVWSDKSTLNSSHYLNAWKRFLEDPGAKRNHRRLANVVGALEFSRGERQFSKVGLKAPDPWTLLVRLKKPTPGIVAHFAHPALWPKNKRNNTALYLGRYLPFQAHFR